MTDHDQTAHVVVTAPEVTWTVKEVFGDLKRDLLKRFDTQDKALDLIDRRLDSTATKEDVHEIHERIDRVESRITPLEQAAADEKAIESNRGRFRSMLAWGAGILASLAITAALVLPFIIH